jgi:hypothetical protein
MMRKHLETATEWNVLEFAVHMTNYEVLDSRKTESLSHWIVETDLFDCALPATGRVKRNGDLHRKIVHDSKIVQYAADIPGMKGMTLDKCGVRLNLNSQKTFFLIHPAKISLQKKLKIMN